MNDDVARGGVFHDAKERVSGPVEVGWLVIRRGDVCADAGRAEGGGGINPLLVVGDGPLALGAVGGVDAVLSIERDVDDHRFCPVECRAEIVQILRFEGPEMTAPGFDLVDVEPGLYVRGEFDELHFWRSRGGRSAHILRGENEVAKWIRVHGQAVARVGGKGDVRLSWI